MKIKKKYTRGTARVFISRKKAVKKLQLSLKDFRRLCILKGIYPREPNKIKKANKGGSTQNKIFYHLRDINFLAQEPLLQKFREYKIFLRKVSHARAKKNNEQVNSLLQRKPRFTYDHIVKERYPTFSSALRDLDDALCLCFAFANLAQSKVAPHGLIERSKRLVTEFMHFVIEAKALRKVFISIKGIYYQAEVMGERVTWLVGHERGVGRANELDFTTMTNFVEFYTCMLAFVNYRLFKSIGLFYPPLLQQREQQKPEEENDYDFSPSNSGPTRDERIHTLAFPLSKTEKSEPDEVQMDTFTAEEDNPNEADGTDIAEKLRRAEALKSLFAKFKFFLNREVPKEPLAFVIRACGGFVCWEDCAPGGITEASELITHQVVDRPVQKMDLNRVYIQPQWVFDCFNGRRLLPAVRYAPTATLPPHLSPFVDEHIAIDQIPQERLEAMEKESKKPAAASTKENPVGKKKKAAEPMDTGMRVQKAKVFKESRQKKINEEGHNLKLREMMIRKKHKRVYERIKRKAKGKAREEGRLRQKRAKLGEVEGA